MNLKSGEHQHNPNILTKNDIAELNLFYCLHATVHFNFTKFVFASVLIFNFVFALVRLAVNFVEYNV